MSLSASAEPSGAELRKVVKEILGIELVSLTQSREEAFAQEMLHFASQKYDSTETKRWNVMVERILDPATGSTSMTSHNSQDKTPVNG